MKKQEMAEYISRQYDRSRMYELWDAYRRCSQAKRNAWEHCKALCYEYGGHGLKILGHNCHFFSAGFLFTDEETGVEKVMKSVLFNSKKKRRWFLK